MTTNSNSDTDGSPSRCPICFEPIPADTDSAPFCSARCRLVDLGKWLKGDYTISREIKDSDIDEGE